MAAKILTFLNLSGTGAELSNTSVPFILPGEPGNLVTDYPEW